MHAVLLYHGIEDGTPSARQMDAVDREYVLDRKLFDAHIEYLARKPPGAVSAVISFDDGDLSGHTIAAPVLEHHGLRGVFFVVTRWIGQPGFMTADHLRDLVRRGHAVQSHSRSHPRLSSLTTAQIDDELRGSKTDLEAILGAAVTQFSIPGGAYDRRVLEAAQRIGYEAVFNSVEGYNGEPAPFVRRRFTPRAYSGTNVLREICEHPVRTKARIALKRTVLGTARGVMGERYDSLRARVVSAFRRTS